jgi:uncharacterized protein (UPF0332 family)
VERGNKSIVLCLLLCCNRNLIKNNIATQTHDGARTQFGLFFVKTGIIDKESGKLFSKLFDYRQKGDYGDLFDYDEELTK